MSAGQLISVFVRLAFVFALLLGGWAWLARRRNGGIRPGRGRLAVLQRLAVGRTSSVIAVRSGESVLILGITEHNVNVLATEPADSWHPDQADPGTGLYQERAVTSALPSNGLRESILNRLRDWTTRT